MHIRHKPWARPELAVCPYFVSQPTALKGQWHDRYGRPQPLWAEFGCGKGSFLAEMASAHPEINFLGVDINSDVLGVARRTIAARFGETPVTNLLLTAFDLDRIALYMDPADRIDRLFLHFPNPWDRPHERKKRLTTPKFLGRYKAYLAPGAEIWFKSDDQPLTSDTLRYFEEAGFTVLEYVADAPEGIYGLPTTEHERMYRAEGRQIGFIRATLTPGAE